MQCTVRYFKLLIYINQGKVLRPMLVLNIYSYKVTQTHLLAVYFSYFLIFIFYRMYIRVSCVGISVCSHPLFITPEHIQLQIHEGTSVDCIFFIFLIFIFYRTYMRVSCVSISVFSIFVFVCVLLLDLHCLRWHTYVDISVLLSLKALSNLQS